MADAGQPQAIAGIGLLAARICFDLLGIEQVGADAGVVERLERDFQVAPVRSIATAGKPDALKPLGQRPQPVAERAEILDDGAPNRWR